MPGSANGNSRSSAGRRERGYLQSVALTGIVIYALGSVACGGMRPAQYYLLEVPPPPAATGTMQGVSLEVASITAPAMLRDDRILYLTGKSRIGTYEYHRWEENPPQMLQQLLVHLLRSEGEYQSVETERSASQAEYRLHGELHEFEEVDSPQGIVTRVRMDFHLESTKTGKMVWMNEYSNDEPVQGKTVQGVVDSMNRNVQKGMLQIAAGLSAYFASRGHS
jgi:ABC-type uncharacterized transport system auxiliary subunit